MEGREKEIVEREKIVGKVWGEWIYDAYSSIKNPEGIIVDVGANIGHFTIDFARKVKKVIAIEPEPRNINLLKKHIAKYRLKNVFIVKKVAWSSKKKLKLYVSDKDMYGHSVVWKGSGKYIEVQGDTLDNILAKLGIEGEIIELMKINVEGAELEVLLGAERCLSITKRIIIQTHGTCGDRMSKNKTTKEVKKFLRNQGFNVHTKIFKGDVTEDLVYGKK